MYIYFYISVHLFLSSLYLVLAHFYYSPFQSGSLSLSISNFSLSHYLSDFLLPSVFDFCLFSTPTVSLFSVFFWFCLLLYLLRFFFITGNIYLLIWLWSFSIYECRSFDLRLVLCLPSSFVSLFLLVFHCLNKLLFWYPQIPNVLTSLYKVSRLVFREIQKINSYRYQKYQISSMKKSA